jgi:hypothetical protein
MMPCTRAQQLPLPQGRGLLRLSTLCGSIRSTRAAACSSLLLHHLEPARPRRQRLPLDSSAGAGASWAQHEQPQVMRCVAQHQAGSLRRGAGA